MLMVVIVWLGTPAPLTGYAFASAGEMAREASVQAITEPAQPESGPGGTAYPFSGVDVHRIGARPTGVTVFEPKGIAPSARADLPVVVLLHGFTAVDPQRYGGWIEHLVRRGGIVVYPDYQDAGALAGGQERYIDNMFEGIGVGLGTQGLHPDQVHVVGHSLGAVLTMVYGVTAAERGLPPAATLTLIAPGGCRTCGTPGGFGVPVPLGRNVPEDTLVSIVAGEDDDLVGTSDARVLAAMGGNLPADQRRSVIVRSDDHGERSLVADHLFPQTAGRGGEEDALDWYGLWRPLDALITCAETGRDCDIALGTSEEALFMGTWSDGTPVATPAVQEMAGPR